MHCPEYDIFNVRNLDHTPKPVTYNMSVNIGGPITSRMQFWIMCSLFFDHMSHYLYQRWVVFWLKSEKISSIVKSSILTLTEVQRDLRTITIKKSFFLERE